MTGPVDHARLREICETMIRAFPGAEIAPNVLALLDERDRLRDQLAQSDALVDATETGAECNQSHVDQAIARHAARVALAAAGRGET